jgi:LmbE family N-acetylglucosaminyl deacetylase
MLGLTLDGTGRRDGYRVLALGAHADDIEIGSGGTVLHLVERGLVMAATWVVFSGAGERADEARASGAAFLDGVPEREIVVYASRDGFFPYSGGAIKEIFERLKREVDPDFVLTHRGDDAHQDHRLISELTWNTFRDHLILEYEIPKYDGDMGRPNLFVPLGEPTYRRKVELLRKLFPSQQSKPWFTEDTFLALMRLRGMESNAPSRYAEAFHCRKLVLAPVGARGASDPAPSAFGGDWNAQR